MDQVKAKYPLVVLYTDEIKISYINELEKIGCICKKEKIKFDFKNYRWHQVFVKFEIFKLIEYQKICFLDADMLIIKNIDYLFDIDEPYIYEVQKNETHINHISTCLMIITPNIELYNKIIHFTTNFFNMNTSGLNYKSFTEEQVLSLFYSTYSEYHLTYFKSSLVLHADIAHSIMQHDKSIYHYINICKPWEVFTNELWSYYITFVMENNKFFGEHYYNLDENQNI